MEIRYVVRGATLRCSHGTQWGRLDLPQSHGAYIHTYPIMIKTDTVPFDNIPSFGGCKGTCGKAELTGPYDMNVPTFSSPASGEKTSNIASITEPIDFEDLDGSIVNCYACTPFTAKFWSRTHPDLLIWKEPLGYNLDFSTVSGEEALLFPQSFLTCFHGGTIEILYHGQQVD